MSWLGDVVSGVISVSSGGGGNWVDVGLKVADTGLNVWSNIAAQRANKQAAQNIADANRQNAEAVSAANQAAQERFERLSADAQPGVTYLKKLTAGDPYSLTPGQQQTLEDQRRASANSLARSGLRGSGRAVTAALRDVDSSLRNKFIDSNLTRSDQAAGQLAGMSGTANANAAGYGVNAAESGTGYMPVNARTEGQADIANTQLQGGALADIGSAVSSLIKEGRKSRYYKDPDQKEAV